MPYETFAAPGRFWRGNIHTHSNLSDGLQSPEEMCRRYREAGYDFLCLSDHFLARYRFPIADTRPFRSDGFTTILGAELHAPANSHGEIWHVLAAGLPEDFAPPAEDETGLALALRARAAGAFVGIAHPQWSSLAVEDGRAMAKAAHAVEIYNTSCDVACARPDGTYLLDALTNEGKALFAYAADDSHSQPDDSFGGWMMVKSVANQPDALLDAIKRGHFYSTQGPLIHEFVAADGELRLSTSPAVNFALLGRGSRNVYRHASGGATEMSLPLSAFAGDWFRLVVRDRDGRLAWTNPVRDP